MCWCDREEIALGGVGQKGADLLSWAWNRLVNACSCSLSLKCCNWSWDPIIQAIFVKSLVGYAYLILSSPQWADDQGNQYRCELPLPYLLRGSTCCTIGEIISCILVVMRLNLSSIVPSYHLEPLFPLLSDFWRQQDISFNRRVNYIMLCSKLLKSYFYPI